MVLSKRERYIFIGTVAAVALLALNYFVLNPLFERKGDLDVKIAELTQQRRNDLQLLSNRDRLRKDWNAMSSGPLKKDGSETESQVYRNLGDWARDARMGPLSISKSDRAEKDRDFYKMTFHASGAGGMSQLSRLLYDIQFASIPVRVTDLNITSKPDGSDELTIQVGVSTIYLAPESEKPAAPPVVRENKS